MADDALAKAGLHFDDLNKIRVLEPEVAQQTKELKEGCEDFVNKIGEFQKIACTFIDIVDKVSQEVEKEKMKAIGARNLIKSMAKQREAQQEQLHAMVAEKRMQLERLHIQYATLRKEENEQSEFLEQLISQK